MSAQNSEGVALIGLHVWALGKYRQPATLNLPLEGDRGSLCIWHIFSATKSKTRMNS